MMDFDKLSLKEQLEIKIYAFDQLIEEDKAIIEYFEKCIADSDARAKQDKSKYKREFSSWEMASATHKDDIRVIEKRISTYKENLYKLKDELYNLKENENMVSS